MGRPKGSKNKSTDTPAPAAAAESPSPVTTEVTEEIISKPAQPAYLARAALLRDVNNHNKELQAEQDAEDLGEEQPAATDTTSTTGEETPPAETTGAETTAEAEVKPEVQAKKKLIIDGEEKEFTEQEIIALAQKNGSADKRLAEATRLLEGARRTATNGAVTDATHETGGTADQLPASQGVDQSLLDEVSEAVVYGDKDMIAKAIGKLIGGGGRQQTTQSAVSPQEIQRYVSETIAFENAKKLLETPSEQGGFADVWADPVLRAEFGKRDDAIIDAAKAEGRPAPAYAERYTKIATELRAWRDGLVKQFAPKTGLENRDQQKRSTGVVRGSGGVAPGPVVMPAKTHEEKLDAMRRSRGLN